MGDVSIAGAILWGVLLYYEKYQGETGEFQSQGRFFGGCCPNNVRSLICSLSVSIAGAILWGVLLQDGSFEAGETYVSIAGAILWGVLLRYLKSMQSWLPVSIAGAILWGVLHS